jgi:hypothetical protein
MKFHINLLIIFIFDMTFIRFHVNICPFAYHFSFDSIMFNDGECGLPISAPHLKLANIHKNLVLKNDKQCETFLFYFIL